MQDIARRITARPGEGKLVWPVIARQRIALFWVITVLSVLAVACQATSPLEADQPRATLARPYAGLEARPIRALAPERIADLLAGRGAGYALAAELNHYPDPAHVLELADQLELTAEQELAVGTVKAAMQGEAQGLGRRLVDLEAELDCAFRSGRITPEQLAKLTADIAEVEGRLRNTHLQAHLQMKQLLTSEQVAHYDRARGYASEDTALSTTPAGLKTEEHGHADGHR